MLLLGIALAVSAFESGGQNSYPVVTAVKGGVKAITNPDYPRDGRFIAKLVEEMSCGEEATPEMAMLNKPLDLKVDDEGRVYIMDWGDTHIKEYDDQGRFLRTIGREFTPLKNARYTGQVGQKKTLPALTRTIVFDDKDNLWLELYKDDKTKGYTYDVFSPGGIYLKHVKLDQRIYEFKKGKAYSIVRPEEGYPSIKRFRLELAPEK